MRADSPVSCHHCGNDDKGATERFQKDRVPAATLAALPDVAGRIVAHFASSSQPLVLRPRCGCVLVVTL